jgi:hypothetical protein
MENETIVVDNTQRDAEVTAFKPNFDFLSSDANLNGEIKTEAPKEEVKEEAKIDNKPEEVVEKEMFLDEPAKEEFKEETKTESTEDRPLEDALTLDDELSSDSGEGWIAYAKSEGLDIAEDTPEAYIEAKIAPYKAELESVKSLTKESLFADMAPEHRMYMELADTGLSHDQIVAPLENIKHYKAMSDVELYREDLMLKYPAATQEWIDMDVEKAVDSGQVTHDATRVRLELDAAEQNITAERQQIIEKYKANRETFTAERSKMESESVKKALNEMSDFMSSPLAPETKKGLTERYNNGKYDQLLKDPIMIAKFIAFNELGEKAVKNIEAKSYNKGKLEIANKLHNTPPRQSGGAGTNMTQVEGNFERLAGDPNLRS